MPMAGYQRKRFWGRSRPERLDIDPGDPHTDFATVDRAFHRTAPDHGDSALEWAIIPGLAAVDLIAGVAVAGVGLCAAGGRCQFLSGHRSRLELPWLAMRNAKA
jgi:hypothetical protein